MDDFKFIFYIILGIVWLIIRVVGKNNKKNGPKPANRPQANRPAPTTNAGNQSNAPKSFEDLLKQLGQEVPTETAKPKPASAKNWYDEVEVDDEAQSLETIQDEIQPERPRSSRMQQDDYERRMRESRREVEEAERRAKAIKEEAAKIRAKKSNRFDEFKIQEKEPNYYAKLLSNPQSIRDAIIVNAILTRPYDDGEALGPGAGGL